MKRFKPLMLIVPDNHPPTHVGAKQFADTVARRTDGNLSVAAVPISKMVNQPSLVDMVVEGAADMALPVHDRLMVCSPKLGCIGAPFSLEDYAHADRLIDGEFAEWVAPDLRDAGLVWLGGWEWGFRQLTDSRRPILRPEDMRGLKIRVPTTPLCQTAILALGAIPVVVEFEQLQRVIRQGLIDGQENPVSVIDSLGLQHNQKYLSMLNYTYGTLIHVINRAVFEGLTPEQQAILREESVKAGQTVRQIVRSQEAEQIARFASLGMHIDHPDPAPFKALMAPVIERLEQMCGADNMRTYLEMADRSRQVPGKVPGKVPGQVPGQVQP